MRLLFIGPALLAPILLCGCVAQTRELYVVMPEGEGKSGTLEVIPNHGQATVLHGDYSAMTGGNQPAKAFQAEPDAVTQSFGGALAAMPDPPISATLLFLTGKDELTADSKATAARLYNAFVARKFPEVWIIGHTDTVGSNRYNDALSVRRAQRVRDTLVKLGIPSDHIVTQGLGKRSLLVQTPDNTSERRNRAVEISVR